MVFSMLSYVISIVICVLVVTSITSIEAKRIKRSRYYPYPPPEALIKYLRRPPPVFFPKGFYSNTPPPFSTNEDPSQSLRPKPGSKPNGLNDEDLLNIVKYLSKEDLHKVIELAGNRVKTPDFAGKDNDIYEFVQTYAGNNNMKYTPINEVVNNQRLNPNFNVPIIKANVVEIPFTTNNVDTRPVYDGFKNDQISDLPNPVNLRHDGDHLGQYSGKYESVIKPLPGYKVESFKDLPVMDYHNSKMFNVDSYKVPHYTITTKSKPEAYKPQITVEPAPPPSAANESDAHLKAIKIWTHHSEGRAYTLHDDGTLSIERPIQKQYGY